MIKYWQSMQDYKYFLNESKVYFDSSERNRLHTELWKPWQKLQLFDTDKAMEFLLPFYSPTGNLDSQTKLDVMELLRMSSNKFHQTILMITHDIHLAQMAGRIIQIEDGRIVN